MTTWVNFSSDLRRGEARFTLAHARFSQRFQIDALFHFKYSNYFFFLKQKIVLYALERSIKYVLYNYSLFFFFCGRAIFYTNYSYNIVITLVYFFIRLLCRPTGIWILLHYSQLESSREAYKNSDSSQLSSLFAICNRITNEKYTITANDG